MLEYEYELCGSMQKMADKLGMSIDTVYKYMKLYNVKYNRNFKGIYTCNENIFKNDDEKSFYLAGFIAADGSIQNRKYSKILKISLSLNDKSHLIKIKNLLGSSHPIKEYTVKPNKLVKTTNFSSEIQIANKILVNDLLKFNIIPNKSLVYKFPQNIKNNKFINHFMRGYFDGDGSISKCGLGKNRTVEQLSFSILGTLDFLTNYQDILINNCQLNKVKICKRNNIYCLSYSGNKIIKKIYDFLYADASIYLQRKKDKFYPVINP